MQKCLLLRLDARWEASRQSTWEGLWVLAKFVVIWDCVKVRFWKRSVVWKGNLSLRWENYTN